MHKPKNQKLQVFTKEIEKFIEEQKSPKERNQDLRKKIVLLGASTKKQRLNFKDIKAIKESNKKQAMQKKSYLLQSGVKKTKRHKK